MDKYTVDILSTLELLRWLSLRTKAQEARDNVMRDSYDAEIISLLNTLMACEESIVVIKKMG